MKMNTLKSAALIFAVIFLLTSCAVLPFGRDEKDTNQSVRFEMESLDSISDIMFEAILDAIENRDNEAIKSMFSEKALADARDIDAAIEYLFNLFDGEVVSWERARLGADESIRGEKYSRQIFVWYDVYTENSKYLFLLLNYDKNTIESDMEGLYTLHAIDDADENALWGPWQDLEFPGVYMPEE